MDWLREVSVSWIDQLGSTLETWNKRSFVVSPDVDGLICGSMLLEKFPDAVCIGSYDSQHVLHFDGASSREIEAALWIDLDVIHPEIKCVGQHLILHDKNDLLPRRNPNSFNPNVYFTQDHARSFKGSAPGRDKYPFGTVHFLRWALQIPLPARRSNGWSVLAHADGSWKTAVDYRMNAQIWYEDMLPGDELIQDLLNGYTGDESSLNTHIGIVNELARIGIKSTTSASRSLNLANSWSQVTGHQALPSFSIGQSEEWLLNFRDLSSFLSSQLGLRPVVPQKVTDRHSGNVKYKDPFEIGRGSFDQFCETEEVFSHAIVSKRKIRYTTGLTDLDQPLES
jgi:hypothetical protein